MSKFSQKNLVRNIIVWAMVYMRHNFFSLNIETGWSVALHISAYTKFICGGLHTDACRVRALIIIIFFHILFDWVAKSRADGTRRQLRWNLFTRLERGHSLTHSLKSQDLPLDLYFSIYQRISTHLEGTLSPLLQPFLYKFFFVFAYLRRKSCKLESCK